MLSSIKILALSFFIMALLISCGTSDILSSFSKRKYLPRVSKRYIPAEGFSCEPSDKTITASKNLVLDELETQIIEDVVYYDEQYVDSQITKNATVSLIKSKILEIKPFSKSRINYNIIKVENHLEKKKENKGLKTLAIVTVLLYVFGFLLLIREWVVAARYLSPFFILGYFSILLAVLLTLVLAGVLLFKLCKKLNIF